jgi:hypothetical protein
MIGYIAIREAGRGLEVLHEEDRGMQWNGLLGEAEVPEDHFNDDGRGS